MSDTTTASDASGIRLELPEPVEGLASGPTAGGHGGHAAESYYVVGEGLLTESAGGREPAQGRADVGAALTRLSAAAPTAAPAPAPPFRFSRMGPGGKAPATAVRKKVALAMTAGGGGFGAIPAGYTYLGQFIDHDLTFDKTTVALRDDGLPGALCCRAARPRWTSTRSTAPAPPTRPRRSSTRPTAAAQDGQDGGRRDRPAGRPPGLRPPAPARPPSTRVIPDKRNDENLVVAQTHWRSSASTTASWTSSASTPAPQRFARARRSVSATTSG